MLIEKRLPAPRSEGLRPAKHAINSIIETLRTPVNLPAPRQPEKAR